MPSRATETSARPAPCLIQARVIALNTDDGLMPITEKRLGDVMIIDLSTRRAVTFWNQEHNVVHEQEVVQDAETGRWIAAECVEIFID